MRITSHLNINEDNIYRLVENDDNVEIEFCDGFVMTITLDIAREMGYESLPDMVQQFGERMNIDE